MRVTAVPVSFVNKQGRTLRGHLHVPAKYTTALVFAHGFPSDSSGSAQRTCAALARAGVLCLRFDFTGCGASDGKHEHRLISTDLTDIRAAIDYLSAHAEFDTLVLLGHSTGAIDAALYAHTDKRLDAIILSGAVGRLDTVAHIDFNDRQVRDFWTRGYTFTTYPMDWSGKKERVVKAYYDEYFTLDIPRSLARYRKPTLVIHGGNDTLVPLACGKEAYANARVPKRFVVIPRADHSYHTNAAVYYAALLRFIRSIKKR